jgi:hypothetical protein
LSYRTDTEHVEDGITAEHLTMAIEATGAGAHSNDQHLTWEAGIAHAQEGFKHT